MKKIEDYAELLKLPEQQLLRDRYGILWYTRRPQQAPNSVDLFPVFQSENVNYPVTFELDGDVGLTYDLDDGVTLLPFELMKVVTT